MVISEHYDFTTEEQRQLEVSALDLQDSEEHPSNLQKYRIHLAAHQIITLYAQLPALCPDK